MISKYRACESHLLSGSEAGAETAVLDEGMETGLRTEHHRVLLRGSVCVSISGMKARLST